MIREDLGASPSGDRATRPTAQAAARLGDTASIPSAGEGACPNCGERFFIDVEATLPAITDLTLAFEVAEGQMIQAKTLAGVVTSFDEMQKAIGEEMGSTTTALIRRLETDGNELRITFAICNSASGIEAATAGETGTGSTEGESPVGDSRDAQGASQ